MSFLASYRRPLLAALLVSVLALIGAACGGSSGSGVPDDSIAVVDKQDISKASLEQLMATAQQNYKTSNKAFPKVGTTDYERLKQQAVQQLVQQTELAVGADQLGVKVTDSDISKKLEQLKTTYFPGKKKGSVDDTKYQKALKAQNMTEDQLKERIAEQLREQKVYNQVTSTVKVTPADITAYYDKNKKTLFTTPESRKVRHILVNDKKTADMLYQQLSHSDAKFAALAKKYSKDPGSAVKGGDLGAITKGQTVAPFDKIAFSIAPGKVSQPVKTQFGYHLIEAMGAVKAASVRPLNAALKQQISSQLSQTKKQQAFFAWYQKLKKDLDKKTKYAEGYAPPTTTGTGATTTAQ